MPVTRDIAEAYIRPRVVMARKLAAGQREDRALAYLMGGCVMMFIAQLPRLSREAHFDPSVPLEGLITGALQGIVFILPLLLYGVAAALHIGTRVFKGQGTWFTTRLVLFWTMLSMAPMFLLHGLVAGFIGPSVQLDLVGGLVLAAFLWLWGNAMVAAEKGLGTHAAN